MINFNDATKENIKEHNPNWLQIPDHPCRILIIGGSWFGKTNWLFNNNNSVTGYWKKVFLYAKNPYEAKYKFLINKRESAGIKHLNDSKSFTEHSNGMYGIYKNIEE